MTKAVAKSKHSFSIRLKAFQDYLEDIPLADICARYDIKMSTLQNWIKTNEWRSRKDEFQSKAVTEIESKYQGIVKRHQLTTLNRKLQLAALIDKSIRRRLLNDDGTLKELTPENLKFISDAFAKNASIDAKILGLLAPQNQMSVFVGSGAMVNIGVSGQPAGQLPHKHEPERVEAHVSPAPYQRPVPDSCPF